MLQINEHWVTDKYRLGESGWYEPFTDNIGRLFKELQQRLGRCVSKIYEDAPDGGVNTIGWVFRRATTETWVFVRQALIGNEE